MATPLVVRGVTIGVLVVQTASRGVLEKDVEMLQTCAQLIAPVVINARCSTSWPGPTRSVARSSEELATLGVRSPGTGPGAREERNVELRGTDVARHRDRPDLPPRGSARPRRRRLHADRRRRAQELRDLQRRSSRRAASWTTRERDGRPFGPEFRAVFNTHVQILEDKGFLSRLERAVGETGNAFEAIQRVVDEYARCSPHRGPYFRERGLDVEDVGRRVMAKLLGVRHHAVPLRRRRVVVTST
jgi:phosphotransferase system, enzyme I, PtsP